MPGSFYRRLLPPQPHLTSGATPGGPGVLEAALTALGNSMLDPAHSTFRPTNGVAPAGYTYLGQFIDHDLTHDRTALDAAGQLLPELTRNERAGLLELDHLYGARPGLDPALYEGPPEEARFLVKPTVGGIPERDVPRGNDGSTLTGDGRREENVILSQLTAVFLRFHNAILERLRPGGDLAPAGGGTRFEQTRRLVTWHYQWIVLCDFLPQIIQREVWRGILARGTPDPRFQPAAGQAFALPVEFTLAGFRYGHTVVRNSYGISPDVRHATLSELINPAVYLDLAAVPPRLRDGWEIEWPQFFVVDPDPVEPQSAARFDPRIAEALHHLPDNSRYPALPVRTLLRGARVGLPSGQEVARAAGVANPLVGAEITRDPQFIAAGFDRHTPLFYYLLKEADTVAGGRWLGPTGSWLVGETIYAALHAQEDSFLRLAPGWLPPLREGNRFAMSQLLRASGL